LFGTQTACLALCYARCAAVLCCRSEMSAQLDELLQEQQKLQENLAAKVSSN
jgi:hypothetical protein